MKKGLRSSIRKKITDLTAEEKFIFSERILSRVEQLPEFKSARVILFFWSLSDEVFTHRFIDKWGKRKSILLPVVKGEELVLKLYAGRESMKAGMWGVWEPTGEVFEEYEKIDLIIVPGVGFDRNGNRLGRGKGYYDKLLPKLSGVKVGVCFSCQLVDSIPCDEWDVKMDKVISLVC